MQNALRRDDIGSDHGASTYGALPAHAMEGHRRGCGDARHPLRNKAVPGRIRPDAVPIRANCMPTAHADGLDTPTGKASLRAASADSVYPESHPARGGPTNGVAQVPTPSVSPDIKDRQERRGEGKDRSRNPQSVAPVKPLIGFDPDHIAILQRRVLRA